MLRHYIIIESLNQMTTRIEIYNQMGEVVMNYFDVNNNEKVSISNLAKGIYLIKVFNKAQELIYLDKLLIE